MLLLTSTSDIVRVVTGSAANVLVHVSWVDNASSIITPGRTNTAAITTATTTTVVASPAASTQRNVKYLGARNTSGSTSTTFTVQHFDGTTSIDLASVTLLPNEELVLDAMGVWHHYDVNGAEYAYTVSGAGNMGATGTIAESIPRELCTETNTTAGATGTLFMQGIYLTAGQNISNITIWSATTAAATTTNLFFSLYSGAAPPALLAQTANQGAYTWAANSVKTLALTSAYRVPSSGLYYVGLLQVATTIATIKGGTARTASQLAAAAPILAGTSTTGLTTTLPSTAAAITAGTASIYAAVS